MGLSAFQIGELIDELGPLLVGARVRAVQPAPPRDLLLVLEGRPGGEILRLRLSVDGEQARLHLQIHPLRRHEGPSDPFYAELQALLEDSVLGVLEQVRGDRVVRLRFRREGRPAGELLAELTGRHANLVLLDGGGRVQAVLHRPAPGSPAAARLAPGSGYALPPGQRSAPGPAEAPLSITHAFPDPPAASDRGPAGPAALARRAPLSARIEAALGGAAERRHQEGLRSDLVQRLERRAISARALLSGLERRAASCDEAERVRQDAELLLAHLARIPRGAREALLPDAYQPGSPERRIPLDPGLAPRRNAEKLFARYKKLLRTRERLPEEQAVAADALRRLEALLERARSGDEDLEALEREALDGGLLSARQEAPRRPARPEPRRPYLRFSGLRGSEIRVGRNAADNDRLTFQEARGNDLWLHTAESPGSHVVLRLERGAEPDPEELLDAAHLAVHYSPLRDSPRVDVHVARRKEVHKPRGAPAGLVTLSGGKVVRLRVEPQRLKRLLDARPRGSAETGETPGASPPRSGPGAAGGPPDRSRPGPPSRS